MGKTALSGTLVAYNVKTGEKVFSENNRLTRLQSGTLAHPSAGDTYVHDGRSYRVIGIRASSTETLIEMDVEDAGEMR